MQNELPEWAMNTGLEIVNESLGATIARALVAAERRGIERAAKVALTRSPDDDNLDWQVRQQVAAAIRQIGEEP